MLVNITMKDGTNIDINRVVSVIYWGNYIEIRDEVNHAKGKHCEVITISDIEHMRVREANYKGEHNE